MDEEMVRRWQKSLAPFDGLHVSSDDYVPLSVLRAALIAVGRLLERYHPVAPLLTLRDWHEHDGCVTVPQPTSWEEVWATLASDDQLYASRSGDFQVSIALFPSDRSFYWRYHPLDKDEEPDHYPGRWGWFDVTCNERLALDLAEATRSAGVSPISVEPAKNYFDRYG
jgi:hypothetical protein